MWSIPLFLTTLAFRNFLAALERPMWSLIVGVVGVLGNILFNYAFIFGKLGMPALGIVGAGVGSMLTNMVMLALMIVGVYRDRRFRRYHLLRSEDSRRGKEGVRTFESGWERDIKK